MRRTSCFRYVLLSFLALALLNEHVAAESNIMEPEVASEAVPEGIEADSNPTEVEAATEETDESNTTQIAAVPGWWTPKPSDKLTWQIQLKGKIDTTFDVDVYEVDLFDVQQSVIDYFHSHGIVVVCYFTAGQYDYWRDDWAKFFNFTTPNQKYTGDRPPFAGDVTGSTARWLDIRRTDLLTPIMTSRISLALTKGCDAIDAGDLDGYVQNTGVPLTYNNQLTYNRLIAYLAHIYRLSAGISDNILQLKDLVADFDFATSERCFELKQCDYYDVFTNASKAVFGFEIRGNLCRFCRMAKKSKLSWIKKKASLKAWRRGCGDPAVIRTCLLF